MSKKKRQVQFDRPRLIFILTILMIALWLCYPSHMLMITLILAVSLLVTMLIKP